MGEMKMNLTDVKNYYVKQIMEQGLAQNEIDAEQLFVNSLTRNLVNGEIMDMVTHIVENPA
jgi:hypothetical protein